jgi:hypothetical protein
LLIDNTATAHLPGPQNPGVCHLYLAEGCHLYIALTGKSRIIYIMENNACPLRGARDGVATAFFAGFNLGLTVAGIKKSRWDHRLFSISKAMCRMLGGPLEERETSQTGMPLLADLLFNRKAG